MLNTIVILLAEDGLTYKKIYKFFLSIFLNPSAIFDEIEIDASNLSN
jgi:hypothetical protein